MHISDTDVLVETNAEKVTDKTQLMLDARVHFYSNPFEDFEILKEFLEMAKDVGKLDSAKDKKKQELVKNSHISDSFDFFVNEDLLDPTRLKAIKLIDGVI